MEIFNDNKLLRKSVEKLLFCSVGEAGKRDQRTRAFIRKTSKNVEIAYKLGVKDRADGKAAAEESMIPALQSESELCRSVSRLAYEAYRAGYASAEGR